MFFHFTMRHIVKLKKIIQKQSELLLVNCRRLCADFPWLVWSRAVCGLCAGYVLGCGAGCGLSVELRGGLRAKIYI